MTKWYNLTTFDLIADLTIGKSLGGSGEANKWTQNLNRDNAEAHVYTDVSDKFPPSSNYLVLPIWSEYDGRDAT
jgi:hypothetical protein